MCSLIWDFLGSFPSGGWGVGGGVSTYIVHKIVPSLNSLVSVANFNAATP